ncbi:hypothetical protein BDBG_05977 [Blastomyces gilchristii SLH14081]|uniref:Uncharacterized protein n=1 Tax=Blastomyces gilchristii (strain SLH14081) TaxID=559298 RepID=A0A179UTF4_BLAGS|nr:uncharacterized protein BDBG_05977 [Blastomyces gilchristii SLH14081]OAT10321.1 hypothetical protein BDBG_05977 [Blastomyces gilchristii SLH14081]
MLTSLTMPEVYISACGAQHFTEKSANAGLDRAMPGDVVVYIPQDKLNGDMVMPASLTAIGSDAFPNPQGSNACVALTVASTSEHWPCRYVGASSRDISLARTMM